MPSARYEALITQMVEPIIRASKVSPTGHLDALMMVCDISAAVLLKVYKTDDERLAALDTFMTRLGAMMDKGFLEKRN